MAGRANADSAPVTITMDAQHPGAAIPADFSGLSFEVSLLLPDENGVHYFRPDNRPLIQLFHTLGVKSLRIGGNTSDRDARQLPGKADLDSLFAFAQAAGVKVIYCLRLHNGDPSADAQIAKYLMDHYADEMDCFSIGQEPSAYPANANMADKKYPYAEYAADWKRFADAIIAVVPDIKFCGPGVHNNGEWAREFIADFGRSNHVSLITEHLYAGGAGGKVPTPEIGRTRMLSDEFTRKYQKLYGGFVPQAISNSLPYRLEEVNNYFNGGAADVSNTFASALWGLDFMYWWAAHGATGVNFHTGDRVAADHALRPSKYTAFYSTTNGYTIRPLGYGIEAFSLGGRGRFIPVAISNPGRLNLSAYAVLDEAQNVYLTVINKEHGPTAPAAELTLGKTGGHFVRGWRVSLAAPGNEIAATNGETLGGAIIENDGRWHGNWENINPASALEIPAGSAAIFKLMIK